MKKVGLALGEGLLIRSMEERDYGVDALVELYEGDFVGQMLFLQVKGTKSPIAAKKKEEVFSLGNFPKRTLMYAEQFVQPFIVAYTCVQDGAQDKSPVYFLWLQRYIERVIDRKTPDWRRSGPDNLTLYLPVIKGKYDPQKGLKELAQRALLESQSMRFIRVFAHTQVLLTGLWEKGATWGRLQEKEAEWILQSLEKCKLVPASCSPGLMSDYERTFTLFAHSIKSGKKKMPDIRTIYLGALKVAMDEIVAAILLRGTEH